MKYVLCQLQTLPRCQADWKRLQKYEAIKLNYNFISLSKLSCDKGRCFYSLIYLIIHQFAWLVAAGQINMHKETQLQISITASAIAIYSRMGYNCVSS